VVQGQRDYGWLYVGTTIGVGLSMGGLVLHGAPGAVGNLGQCRLGPREQTLDAVAGRVALEAAGRSLNPGSTPGASLEELVALAIRGEQRAIDLVRSATDHIGFALSNVLSVLNPGTIVVAGDLMSAGPLVLDALRSSTTQHIANAQEVTIVGSTLKEAAPLLGAISASMHVSSDKRAAASRTPPC
jgi:predicted NBD/HSP70 family sugar kinase